ncbi:MAG TPA: STAS domain-containing protein [Spirochaetia bacterium]|nr:STAS domain-containing protein [Spirochaetia bacterium]
MVQVREIATGEVEVLPSGHLTREDMDELSKGLAEALVLAKGAIVLNFESLKSLNSSIIGKLLHFKAQCDQKGIRLSIRHCSSEMLQLLKMIRFDTLIQMEI